MSYDFVLDSFAWVEYFRGSPRGKRVEQILESGGAATPTVVIAELSDLWSRSGVKEWARDLAFITAKTAIIDLTAELAVAAGKLKNAVRSEQKDKARFGLADAMVLATARKLGAKVVSGDEHFKNLSDVEYLD